LANCISVISSLKACQHPDGGFGGGHGQIAHLAPTYAAINALALYGADAFEIVDRRKLYSWLMSLKQDDGGFLMHHGGEEDARYEITEERRIHTLDLPTQRWQLPH